MFILEVHIDFICKRRLKSSHGLNVLIAKAGDGYKECNTVYLLDKDFWNVQSFKE